MNATVQTEVENKVVSSEQVQVNVEEYLLADMFTSVYLFFRKHDFKEKDTILAYQHKGNPCQISPFDPMHFDKNGERGMITKRFFPILSEIQTLCRSCVRVGKKEDVTECYAAISKTIENKFNIQHWFNDVSAFDADTSMPSDKVPMDYIPSVQSILYAHKLSDGRITYENRLIIRVNVELDSIRSLFPYVIKALLKIRARAKKDEVDCTIYVGAEFPDSKMASIVSSATASPNQPDFSDADSENSGSYISYMIPDGDTFKDEIFAIATPYDKMPPFVEQKKLREPSMAKHSVIYAKV